MATAALIDKRTKMRNPKEIKDLAREILKGTRFSLSRTEREALANPEAKSTDFHHTLGRKIRNEFQLHRVKWTPLIRNGVDHAAQHPDNVSDKVIKELMLHFQKN